MTRLFKRLICVHGNGTPSLVIIATADALAPTRADSVMHTKFFVFVARFLPP